MFQGVTVGFGINGTGAPLMADITDDIWWLRGKTCASVSADFSLPCCAQARAWNRETLNFQHSEEAGHLHARVCLSF